MPPLFRQLFDSIISALGGGFDKPRSPLPTDATLPPQETTTTPPPKLDPGQQYSFYGVPIDPATDCRVCGLSPAKPEYYDQFCSYECEQRMADSMDAWHDQFEERFGDD